MTKQKSHTALVTGSTQGIGKAIAIDFASNGMNVIVTGRNKENLENVMAELSEYSINSYSIAADLNDPNGVESIDKYITGNDLNVDVLVNNAAILIESELLLDIRLRVCILRSSSVDVVVQVTTQ